MLFPSEEFLFAFLPVVLVVYYALLRRNVLLKNIWLLLASLMFYAWGEPVYVCLMVAVVAADYLLGLLIDRVAADKTVARRCLLVVTIVANLGVLGWFKYANFIVNEVARVSGGNADGWKDVVLPIGISFFTFQAMSYVFDVYKGEVKAEKNPVYVGLYVSFFPQLIAGPIVRYQTVAKQMRERKESLELFSEGVVRFLKGLIKKVIIANNMAIVADAAWELLIGDRLEASVAMAWLGAISYTLQIFFDFSGYSDMAIGLGRMFGFKFLENFDHPYISGSVTEFWRRWHMSLSSWFKDYVYIPLGGSRKGQGRTIFNLFVVWLLTGIWHGANWTFILWGLLYFIVLTIEKLAKVKPGQSRWWGHIYTMIVVCLAWVVFRSDSVSDAWIYIKATFGAGSGAIIDGAVAAYIKQNAIYYVMALVGCLPVLGRLESYFDDKNLENKTISLMWNLLFLGGMGILTLVAVSFIINNAYSPFIYFNF